MSRSSRLLHLLLLLPSSFIIELQFLPSLKKLEPPLLKCNASSANLQPRQRNSIVLMPSKKIQKSASGTQHDSSALRELKEIVAKQAGEIKALKSALLDASKSSSSSPRIPPTPSNSAQHPASSTPTSTESKLKSDPISYLNTPFYTLALRRVYWLAIFLISLSLTAIIMNEFESTLSKQIELAYFVPLLAGHGGNTGGQTIGSVLSALSTKSITTADASRIIRKEASSGLTVGCILGIAVGWAAYLIGGVSVHVSAVVGCTLPILSGVAGVLASGIPFLCVGCGLDPAVIAAPAMTTFVDVSGLLSYFYIAGKVFRWFGVAL